MKKTDETGAYTECFAYSGSPVPHCSVLKDWYGSLHGKRCEGCTFFKSAGQYEYEKRIYPYIKPDRE